MSKAEYVRTQSQTRKHHCHWPGCDKQVPPAMWGCKGHWFALPAGLRARIWATFRPGQEVNGTPSAGYIAAAKDVQAWVSEREAAAEPVDQYGNPVDDGSRLINCCYPDCGCDGARLCNAESGASGVALSLNIERGSSL